MKDKTKFISDKDCRLIERISADMQSGNHLLRKRDDEYWSMWNLMIVARKAEKIGTADDRQKEMCEYERQCGDYFYWKGLLEEEKLFVEE